MSFIDLSKVPVGLTLTTKDCQIVMNALVGTIYPQDEDRAQRIMEHVRNCSEASLRKHREAGVQPAQPARHLHQVEAVMAPLRALPNLGDVA